MNSLVPIVRLMERPPVALCLHVVRLDLSLSHEVRHPVADVIVVQHIPEVIQSQVFHFCMVPVSREVDHLGRANMLVLTQMGGGQELESVTHHVTIKFHQ